MIRVLQQISLPGSEKNEDAIRTGASYAVLLDGATTLVPARQDAVWFTSRFLDAFDREIATAKSLAGAVNASIRDVLRQLPADVRLDDLDYYPSAAGLFLWEGPDSLQFLTIGDCTAVFRMADGRVLRVHRSGLDRLDGHVLRAMKTAANASGMPLAQTRGLEDIRAMLLANRQKMNRRGGYRTLSYNTAPVRARDVIRFQPGAVREFLFFSDGFELAEDDLLKDGADFAEAGRRLRAIENADAGCSRYPRFKQHDDASALLGVIE